jgi:hypothetical protein
LLDLEEAEGNLERVAHELKEQDYDFMEVLNEQEEIESEFERERERDLIVIDEQRRLIESQDREREVLRAEVEERERIIREKEEEIARLKKRSRGEFEANTSITNEQQQAKRFRLNCEHNGVSSAGSCNSGKYHRFCKHPQ